MYKNIELESTKYWAASVTSEYKQFRKTQRQKAFARCFAFAVFGAAAAGLCFMLVNGYFENVDVIGTIQRVGHAIGIGR